MTFALAVALLALGVALGGWFRPQASKVVVMLQQPSSPWERWEELSDQDEIPEWTPEDVEWLHQVAESWTPVSEAEGLYRAAEEGWSEEEEPWWLGEEK